MSQGLPVNRISFLESEWGLNEQIPRKILEPCLQHTLLSVILRREHETSRARCNESGTFSLHSRVCKGPGAGKSSEFKKMDQGPTRGGKVSGEDVGKVEST